MQKLRTRIQACDKAGLGFSIDHEDDLINMAGKGLKVCTKMNKILILLFIGLITLTYGQQSTEPSFDVADFNKKMEVAEWLYEYDMIVWRTSDSVMMQDKNDLAKLGNDWFFFQRNDTWHAVFGKYENNQFDLVFHFKADRISYYRQESEPLNKILPKRYWQA